jgi:hypothetical protein
MMKDKQRRLYARLPDLKVGDYVVVDGDFTCLEPWSRHEVLGEKDNLYIKCTSGNHFLDAQLQEHTKGYLMGIYPDGTVK